MLIDGIDPDAEAGEKVGTFTPKSPSEVLEAKSAVLSNAVKPKPAAVPKPVPVIKPKTNVGKTEDAPVSAEVVAEKGSNQGDVKAPEDRVPIEPVPELSPDVISEIAEGSVEGLNISGPQKGAIANIIRVRTKMAQEGKISVKEYNNMSADYANIKDNVSGAAFLKKYNVVGKYD
jgi:hypothetical protein